MAFEKFTQIRSRGFSPAVSIWKGGQISFNQGAVRRFGLKEGFCVVLYFDPEQQKIGIRTTDNVDEDGAIKVSFRQTGAMVSARAFLDFYNISREKTRRYKPGFDEENGLYTLDIRSVIEGGEISENDGHDD